MARDLVTENWKDVKGYEGLYQVSSWGRVKSLARMKKIRTNGLQPLPEKILGITRIKHGSLKDRCVVNLWKDGKFKTWQVHRLVLLHFVGPCPDGMECCHHNGNPSDNRLGNLRWDTHDSNQKEMARHGRSQAGERNAFAKLTEKSVLEIRNSHLSDEKLAFKYQVLPNTIRDVRLKKTWRHI